VTLARLEKAGLVVSETADPLDIIDAQRAALTEAA